MEATITPAPDGMAVGSAIRVEGDSRLAIRDSFVLVDGKDGDLGAILHMQNQPHGGASKQMRADISNSRLYLTSSAGAAFFIAPGKNSALLTFGPQTEIGTAGGARGMLLGVLSDTTVEAGNAEDAKLLGKIDVLDTTFSFMLGSNAWWKGDLHASQGASRLLLKGSARWHGDALIDDDARESDYAAYGERGATPRQAQPQASAIPSSIALGDTARWTGDLTLKSAQPFSATLCGSSVSGVPAPPFALVCEW